MPHVPDEQLLMALLNSTPVIDGVAEDRLTVAVDVSSYLHRSGVDIDTEPDTGEHTGLVRARDLLQAVVRGELAPTALAVLLIGVRQTPRMVGAGIEWMLEAPAATRTAARAVLAWDQLRREQPGRLRPCANTDCRLFFVDRSRPGTGRWCSMAVCGNRMKARRHHTRSTRSRVTPSDETGLT